MGNIGVQLDGRGGGVLVPYRHFYYSGYVMFFVDGFVFSRLRLHLTLFCPCNLHHSMKRVLRILLTPLDGRGNA